MWRKASVLTTNLIGWIVTNAFPTALATPWNSRKFRWLGLKALWAVGWGEQAYMCRGSLGILHGWSLGEVLLMLPFWILSINDSGVKSHLLEESWGFLNGRWQWGLKVVPLVNYVHVHDNKMCHILSSETSVSHQISSPCSWNETSPCFGRVGGWESENPFSICSQNF